MIREEKTIRNGGQFDGRKLHTMTFDSLSELASYTKEHGYQKESPGRENSASWYDPSSQTTEQCLADVFAQGTSRHADIIEKAKQAIKVPAFRLYGSVPTIDVGPGVPIIPAVLAGVPEHNLTLSEAADVTTPIRILFNRSASAFVSAKDMQTVGATVAAVIEIMQASRPVEVYICSHGDAYKGRDACSVRVKLSSHPSQAELSLGCITTGLVRRFMYEIRLRDFNSKPELPAPFSEYTQAGSIACFSDIAEPSDIQIHRINHDDELVTKPSAWAEAALKKAFGDIEAHC